MVSRHKQLIAIVLGGVLGLASGAWAEMRLVTTSAGCLSNFKRGSLYNACVSCVKSHGRYKMNIHKAWSCQ